MAFVYAGEKPVMIGAIFTLWAAIRFLCVITKCLSGFVYGFGGECMQQRQLQIQAHHRANLCVGRAGCKHRLSAQPTVLSNGQLDEEKDGRIKFSHALTDSTGRVQLSVPLHKMQYFHVVQRDADLSLGRVAAQCAVNGRRLHSCRGYSGFGQCPDHAHFVALGGF